MIAELLALFSGFMCLYRWTSVMFQKIRQP